jgi:hypothetical protein
MSHGVHGFGKEVRYNNSSTICVKNMTKGAGESAGVIRQNIDIGFKKNSLGT